MNHKEAYDKGWQDCLERYAWSKEGTRYVSMWLEMSPYTETLADRHNDPGYDPPEEEQKQKKDRHVGQAGKQFFKEWEGLRTHEYLDSGGVSTIGIGHLLRRSERTSGKIMIQGWACPYRDGLTVQQCWELLSQDLELREEAVNDAVKVPLNQNQFDALVSFTFNVGNGAFVRSTLLKRLNNGLYEDVPDQLRRWNIDNGRVVQGLVNRREKEITLWNMPV